MWGTGSSSTGSAAWSKCAGSSQIGLASVGTRDTSQCLLHDSWCLETRVANRFHNTQDSAAKTYHTHQISADCANQNSNRGRIVQRDNQELGAAREHYRKSKLLVTSWIQKRCVVQRRPGRHTGTAYDPPVTRRSSRFAAQLGPFGRQRNEQRIRPTKHLTAASKDSFRRVGHVAAATERGGDAGSVRDPHCVAALAADSLL